MHRLQTTALLILLMPWMAQADQVIEVQEVTITMPDSYRHVEKRGVDSSVGEIITPSGFNIGYDLGQLAGSRPRLPDMPKEKLAEVVFFEDHPQNAPTGFLIITRYSGSDPLHPKGYGLSLSLGEDVGNLGLLLTEPDRLPEARQALQALRVRKRTPLPMLRPGQTPVPTLPAVPGEPGEIEIAASGLGMDYKHLVRKALEGDRSAVAIIVALRFDGGAADTFIAEQPSILVQAPAKIVADVLEDYSLHFRTGLIEQMREDFLFDHGDKPETRQQFEKSFGHLLAKPEAN